MGFFIYLFKLVLKLFSITINKRKKEFIFYSQFKVKMEKVKTTLKMRKKCPLNIKTLRNLLLYESILKTKTKFTLPNLITFATIFMCKKRM